MTLGLIFVVMNNMGIISRFIGLSSDSTIFMVEQYQEKMQYFYGDMLIDAVPQSLEERQELLDDEAQRYTWDTTNRTVTYDYSDGSSTTITGVDIDTFMPLIHGFASDANMLYFEGVATNIPMADHPKLVGNLIVTDKQVYDLDRSGPLVGVDPQTFKVAYTIDGKATAYYQDKYGRYNYSGRKILADYESFEVLGKYARDNKHVYLDHSIVSGADPKTFVDL